MADHSPCKTCSARHIAQLDRLIELEKSVIAAHEFENQLRIEIVQRQRALHEIMLMLERYPEAKKEADAILGVQT